MVLPSVLPTEEVAHFTTEYLSGPALENYGAMIATVDSASFMTPFLDAAGIAGLAHAEPAKRQRDNHTVLGGIYRSLFQSAEGGAAVSPAAEWLIDNYQLVEENIRQVRRDLPARFYRQLPVFEEPPHGAMPRVTALASAFVAHSHCVVDADRLCTMVDGYQSKRPLRIGELWALPSILRFVLVEQLRAQALRIDARRRLRDQAHVIANAILATGTGESGLADLRARPALADDDAFASQLLYRLRDGSESAQQAIVWLEAQLERRGSDAEEVIVTEQQRVAAGTVHTGNIVRSLRNIDDINWAKWFARVSLVDARLRAATDFDELDFTSQDKYRGAIERLARGSGLSELEVTGRALESLALEKRAHVTSPGHASRPVTGTHVPDIGHYLVGALRPAFEDSIGSQLSLLHRVQRWWHRLGWLSIAVPVTALTLVATASAFFGLIGTGLSFWLAGLLAVLASVPASEAATGLFNSLVTRVKSPSSLVGYKFEQGVPAASRTLVVVPCLLSSRDEIDDLVRNLEVHYLSNTRGEIYFAIASDWSDAGEERSDRDDELLAYARACIAELKARYAHTGRDVFHLAHRRRLWNESEACWMGWERKRGKLLELNRLLRGDDDTSFVAESTPLPDAVQYVVTLDADTRMTRDAVTRLVGKMVHPINRPVLDVHGRQVIAGHALMQPRVMSSLTTGKEASLFQRVYSQDRGLDPYVFTVSDVYQDLTGEGSFTGKGIYELDTLHTVLNDRFDENTILSHDLLEGAFARCALATDVELVEAFPVRYEVEAARQHRWIRGDWQLLPLVLRSAGPHGVAALGRWKMVDNLRRSLVPVAWLAATIIGWLVLPLPVAIVWQSALVLALFVPPTLGLLRDALQRAPDHVTGPRLSSLLREIVAASAQVGLRLVFVAHTAVISLTAIVTSLWRVYVSRRHLLEWRTAAQTGAGSEKTVASSYRWMQPAVWVALASAAAVVLPGKETAWLALPFCLLWMASPLVAWWVSRSAETVDRLVVDPGERLEMRRIARRTWDYFDTFVTDEHHALPPDNFQEIPDPVVAGRTSPTNIGLYLLSVLSARDFGWIGMRETVERLEQTMATLEALEKHRGHLYNWYDTRTALPLSPPYVSAVDSGNLAGHLIALSSGLREWAEALFAWLQTGVEGIGDVAGVLGEELEAVPDDRRAIRPLRRRLEEGIHGIRRATLAAADEPGFVAASVASLRTMAVEIDKLASELDHETGSKETASVKRWAQLLVRNCDSILSDTHFDNESVEVLRRRMIALRDTSRGIAFEMNFRFLLREDRRLLAIGYRVDADELDESCYDLLASEARLASLFGIAKGDLPTEHWFRLGRSIVQVGTRGALMSWSGSMFEYLMAPLVMREQQGGILHQTNALVVQRQIEYGMANGVPWGVSESAFSARDREMTYQYSCFGVPSLGMKRGLGQDLVIAPYASILASQYRPHDALENLDRLRATGALGQYGYYDAVDFTRSRLPDKVSSVVVRNYMAHHHGMSILALSNVVFHGRLRQRFHADPVIEAAELLLQERAPKGIPLPSARDEVNESPTAGSSQLTSVHQTVLDPGSAQPEVTLLSNGHYALMLTATGAGYSTWNGMSVTRWQLDRADDRWGSFLFLRDPDTSRWWSATAAPRANEETTSCHTVFSDSMAEFHKRVGNIESRVDVIVASKADAEGRRITLTNHGTEDRTIEVTSYTEPVLSTAAADLAHPAFSKMFVRTTIADDGCSIHAVRNKRRHDEPDMQVVHLIGDASNGAHVATAETDRRRFIGRGRTLATAAAFDSGATTGTTTDASDGFTLDPVFVLRRTLKVPAGKSASAVFWTIAAPDAATLDTDVANLRHHESFDQEAMHAWTRSQVQLRYVGTQSVEAGVFQRMARYLIVPDAKLGLARNDLHVAPQSALWPMGISGDYPLFVLRIDTEADMAVVRKALRAQEYLRARGLIADLVILNERAASYAQDLQHAIDALCENARSRGVVSGPREHIFALRREILPPEASRAVLAAARIVFHARNGTFSAQMKSAARAPEANPVQMLDIPRETRSSTGAPTAPGRGGDGLRFYNGYGGFSDSGREYVVRTNASVRTPHPWINVLANEGFGSHVSADGAGYTWSRNSRDYQLTPWSNDPVIDRPGEAFYVHDVGSGRVVSPMAGLSEREGGQATDSARRFETRHGLGYSSFSSGSDDADELLVELVQTVHTSEPVKLSSLRLSNPGAAARVLKIYAYAEWVLGNDRGLSAPYITVHYDRDSEVMCATNPYSVDYTGRTAFLACDHPVSSITASRAGFIGTGSVRLPQMVDACLDLDNSTDTRGDPCSVLCCDVRIAPGASVEILFLLGDTESREVAQQLVASQREAHIQPTLAATDAKWHGITDVLQIDTPDDAMNVMVNAWLPYQSIACRLTARAAFYQASGAFGFRDQLQDTLAFLLHDPRLARQQIVNAAGRQFPEGDVQHWWLPNSGTGVRTMISDDVVWLGHAVAHYVRVTGDDSLLDVSVPFLLGPELDPGEHDRMFAPDKSDESVTIYEHCALALELAIRRTGEHGLPLMLGGDWNDGMNRVGEQGRGQSVWLGWFLAQTLDAFSPIAERRGDANRVVAWRAHLSGLLVALDTAGWDGAWYRRGYYDDGTPLGSGQSDECRIDSIAQSWSVLSGLGDPVRSASAMDAVLEHLVDDEAGLVRLFKPSFEHTGQEPGYIKGYPPGVRENGGQYTHAATWVIYALAQQGRGDDAHACFARLNPVTHAMDQASADTYRVEPYAVAADIYASPDKLGRGGWTWYTGSAGWLYRAAVEAILGITKRGDRLFVNPALPREWDGYSAELKIDGQSLSIRVVNKGPDGYETTINAAAIDTEGHALRAADH